MGGAGASPVGTPFYYIRNGVVSSEVNATGASHTYDSTNDRLSVTPDADNRSLIFSPSVDITNYTALKVMLRNTSTGYKVKVVTSVDSAAVVDTNSADTNDIQTVTVPLNGSELTSLSLATLVQAQQFYIYNMWLE